MLVRCGAVGCGINSIGDMMQSTNEVEIMSEVRENGEISSKSICDRDTTFASGSKQLEIQRERESDYSTSVRGREEHF